MTLLRWSFWILTDLPRSGFEWSKNRVPSNVDPNLKPGAELHKTFTTRPGRVRLRALGLLFEIRPEIFCAVFNDSNNPRLLRVSLAYDGTMDQRGYSSGHRVFDEQPLPENTQTAGTFRPSGPFDRDLTFTFHHLFDRDQADLSNGRQLKVVVT